MVDKMTKNNQYRIEYAAFLLFEFCIRLLPTFLLEPLSKFFAFIAFKVIKYRYRVALNNLAIAFPEKSEQERFSIAYRSVQHFILVIFEFMKFSRWSYEKLEKKLRIESPEMFEIILENNKDKGIIFVGGHFGNWEIPIIFLASGQYPPLSIIQQRQKNHLVDQHLTNIRARRGIKYYYAGDAIMKGVKDLKNKGIVAIVCDQDAGNRGVFVSFFGRMASTPIGAALLHLHSNSKLVFAACVRTGHLQYKGIMTPVQYQGNYDVTEQNIEKITQAFTSVLQEMIRQYPEQYLWTHRRWKTSPGSKKP
jgi:KDO2-lipid IV(A) lauroyltransferase